MPKKGPPPRYFPRTAAAGTWLADVSSELEPWWPRLNCDPTEAQKEGVETAVRNFRVAKSVEHGDSLRDMKRRVKLLRRRKKSDGPYDKEFEDTKAIVADQMMRQAIKSLEEFLDLLNEEKRILSAGGAGEITLKGAEPTFVYIGMVMDVLRGCGVDMVPSNRWDEKSLPTQFEQFLREFFFPELGTDVTDRRVIQHAMKKAAK